MPDAINVDAVAFDVGNTLTASPLPDAMQDIAQASCVHLQDCGFGIAPQAIAEAWLDADRTVDYPFASHFLQEEPIVQRALADLGIPAATRSLVAPELLSICRRAIQRVLEGRKQPELLAALGDLRGRGKVLAVMSNDRAFATPTMLDWLGLAREFSQVIVSEEVGYEKPSPELFGELSRRIRTPPDRIAYVGDDTVRDVEAGRKAGLKVILWRPGGKAPEETLWATSRGVDARPDAVLTAWRDLPGLIG